MNLSIKTPSFGDVAFSRTTGWVSRVTCNITDGPASHQFSFRSPDYIVEMDSGHNGIVTTSWNGKKKWMLENGAEYLVVHRIAPLTDDERGKLECLFDWQDKKYKYSFAELGLQAMDYGRVKTRHIDRLSNVAIYWRKLGDIKKNWVICSKESNESMVMIHSAPSWAVYWSPNDSLCYFQKQNGLFEIVEVSNGFFDWPKK